MMISSLLKRMWNNWISCKCNMEQWKYVLRLALRHHIEKPTMPMYATEIKNVKVHRCIATPLLCIVQGVLRHNTYIIIVWVFRPTCNLSIKLSFDGWLCMYIKSPTSCNTSISVFLIKHWDWVRLRFLCWSFRYSMIMWRWACFPRALHTCHDVHKHGTHVTHSYCGRSQFSSQIPNVHVLHKAHNTASHQNALKCLQGVRCTTTVIILLRRCCLGSFFAFPGLSHNISHVPRVLLGNKLRYVWGKNGVEQQMGGVDKVGFMLLRI